MKYSFSECVLDEKRHELARSGTLIRTEPKVFAVLCFLLKNRDRVVTREELLDHCWPGIFVSDGTLSRCLSRVRQVIGQNRSSPEMIQTVHGHGYRFICAVEESEEPVAAFDVAAPEHKAPPETPLAVAEEGASLVDRSAHPVLITERRQLTVLNCEIDNVETLVAETDSEPLFELLRSFHAVGAEVFDRFEGNVSQRREYGFVVYFGYPHSQEDGPCRAVHAALDLMERVGEFDLVLRIGINTGQAIVDRSVPDDVAAALAVGITPSVAEALKREAAAGTVAVTAATARLVRGYFQLSSAGTQLIANRTVEVLTATKKAVQPTRLEVEEAKSGGLTPFVGRAAELSILRDCWLRAREGIGQTVLVSGDPGIGKSRLLHQLRTRVDVADGHWLRVNCSPYFHNVPYYPLLDMLYRIIGFDADADPIDNLEALENLLIRHRMPLPQTVPLMASLLSISVPPHRMPALDTPPEDLKRRTEDTLVGLIQKITQSRPTALIVEDLHWADSATLGALERIVTGVPATSMMVVCSYGARFALPWSDIDPTATVRLSRLGREDSKRLVNMVAGSVRLSLAMNKLLVDTTDGVPIYIEELTRGFIAYDSVDPDALQRAGGSRDYVIRISIPATLQDRLLASLDRLGDAKALAQWCALLGRTTTYATLAAVVPMDEETLSRNLEKLVKAGLLHQISDPPDAEFTFKHALVRHAAHESLLPSECVEHHKRIATALEREFPEFAESQPAELAYHYGEAGMAEKSVSFWRAAGDLASGLEDFEAAERSYRYGLEQFRHLSPSAEAAEHELAMQLGLGHMAVVRHGAIRDAETAFARARELADQIGDTGRRFLATLGSWWVCVQRADVVTARPLARQLMLWAEESGLQAHRLESLVAAGVTNYMCQEFDDGAKQLYRARELCKEYNPATDPNACNAISPELICLLCLAHHESLRGNKEEAIALIDETLEKARARKHPYSLVCALHHGIDVVLDSIDVLGSSSDEIERRPELIEEQITVANQHGFEWFETYGRIYREYNRALGSDNSQAAFAALEDAVNWQLERAPGQNLTFLFDTLAKAAAANGQIDVAKQYASTALEAMETNKHRSRQIRLQALMDNLLQAEQSGHAASRHRRSGKQASKAEELVKKTLEGPQGRPTMRAEIRSTTALAAMLAEQGQFDKARDLLTPVFDLLTQEVELADVVQAKSLLERIDQSN